MQQLLSRLGSSQLIQMFISYSKKKTLTKTSITSLATRGPSSWDTGQANHYCPEGLQGKAEEGVRAVLTRDCRFAMGLNITF